MRLFDGLFYWSGRLVQLVLIIFMCFGPLPFLLREVFKAWDQHPDPQSRAAMVSILIFVFLVARVTVGTAQSLRSRSKTYGALRSVVAPVGVAAVVRQDGAELSENDFRQILIHECGHAILARLLPELPDPSSLRVMRYHSDPIDGATSGRVTIPHQPSLIGRSPQYVWEVAQFGAGGRSADKLCNGGIHTGVLSDMQHVIENVDQLFALRTPLTEGASRDQILDKIITETDELIQDHEHELMALIDAVGQHLRDKRISGRAPAEISGSELSAILDQCGIQQIQSSPR